MEPTTFYCGDPNLVSFNPRLVILGSGAKAGLRFLRTRRKRLTSQRSVTLPTMYAEFLNQLRQLPEAVLASLGLGAVLYSPSLRGERNPPTFRVIYDLMTGNIYCMRRYEHQLCKVPAGVKHLMPNYRYTQHAHYAKPWLHPVVTGPDKKHLTPVVWNDVLPDVDLLFRLVEMSYIRAHEGMDEVVIPRFLCLAKEPARKKVPQEPNPITELSEVRAYSSSILLLPPGGTTQAAQRAAPKRSASSMQSVSDSEDVPFVSRRRRGFPCKRRVIDDDDDSED